MNFKKFAYTLLIITIALVANAQEVLVNLSSYPTPKTDNKTKVSLSKAKSILELPFFDDFARPTVFPTSELWESSDVLCNLNYAINPPNIGVATFDAINSKGELYEWLTTTPQGADTLTSLPINLAYPASDSIYLSFSFQPRGLGIDPTDRDSLVLELWDEVQTKWVRAWSASYTKDSLRQNNILNKKSKKVESDTLHKTFHNAIICIEDEGFLTSNFKFRFINYASISENATVPGLLYNSDHWHIDMVYLNKDRFFEDTVFNDVAFSRPIKNLMINYTSVPWSHFSSAYSSEFPSPLKINTYYKNLGPITWLVSTKFNIYDLSGLKPDSLFPGGVANIDPYQEYFYSRFFDLSIKSAWQDSAKYSIQSIITLFNTPKSTIPTHFLYNDTISRVIEFHNYYSFDDGSAEMGYGLFGEGTIGATIAQKFYNYKADTLKGVMIYFNRTYNDANDKPFRLMVWSDDNGKPGNVIYQKNSVRPKFTDSLNKFSVYRIEPLVIPAGNFYIGWMQENQDMLNVGFDMNTDNKSRLFYNMYGDWENTQKEGTLMIRPILGKMHQIPTNVTPIPTNQNISVYPNPAKDNISIKVDNDAEIAAIQIINSVGNVVLSQNYYSQEPINIQNIPTGLYIVKVCPKKGKCITSKLLIVR